MPHFGFLSIPLFLVMYMHLGGSPPVDAMPELLQRLMLVSPTTRFVAFVHFRGADWFGLAPLGGDVRVWRARLQRDICMLPTLVLLEVTSKNSCL